MTRPGEPLPGPPIRAILFDIDGTILTSGGAGAAAWSRAFEDVCGQSVDTERVTESGMTDREVVLTALRTVMDGEPDQADIDAVTARYLAHLPDTVADSDHYRLTPGIVELLERLDQTCLLLGLTTGNIEPAARIKLARGDLNRFFPFGGFGSDSSLRSELTRRAVERGIALATKGGEGRPAEALQPADFIAVGDTPRDVAAARAVGIRIVAVATGNFSLEQLRGTGPDWVIETVESGFPV